MSVCRDPSTFGVWVLVLLGTFVDGAFGFHTFTFTNGSDDVVDHGLVGIHITLNDGPVREDHLWKGLTTGGGTQGTRESKGLSDGQVSSQHFHGGTQLLFVVDDNTQFLGQEWVDGTGVGFWHGNFSFKDGFHDGGLGVKHGRVTGTAGDGHNLTHTSVNGIGVKGDVNDVATETTHVFFANWSFTGGVLAIHIGGIVALVQVLGKGLQRGMAVPSIHCPHIIARSFRRGLAAPAP